MRYRFPLCLSLTLFVQPAFADFTISSFSYYDVAFNDQLDGDCHYDARITGTLTPVYSRADWSRDVEAHFDISAHLYCPHMTPSHRKEHIAQTGPITREHVEALLSRHATMTRIDVTHRCLYVPTVQFRGESLVRTSLETRCTRLSE